MIIKNTDLIQYLLKNQNIKLSEFLKKFNINISTLQNLKFTDYKYNILQISVYFLNFNLILTIFEEKEFFNFLNYECFYSNDSLWDICISKQNIKMFGFLFDKVFIPLKNKKINIKNGIECIYNDSPLFYIHNEEFIKEIYFWVNEWKKKKTFNKISTENLLVLEKFFHIVKNDIHKEKFNLINNSVNLKKFSVNKNKSFQIKENKYSQEKIKNNYIKETDLKKKEENNSSELEIIKKNESITDGNSDCDYTLNNEKIEFLEKNVSENSKSNSSFLDEKFYFIQKPITKKLNKNNLYLKDIKRIKSKGIKKNSSANINYIKTATNKIFSFKNMKKFNNTQEFFNKDISCKFIKKNNDDENSCNYIERQQNKENSSKFFKENSSQFFKNESNSYKKKNSSKFFKEKKNINELSKFKKKQNLEYFQNENFSNKFLKKNENLSLSSPHKSINKIKANFFQQIFQSKNNLLDEEI